MRAEIIQGGSSRREFLEDNKEYYLEKDIQEVVLNLNIYYSADDKSFDDKVGTFSAQEKALNDLG